MFALVFGTKLLRTVKVLVTVSFENKKFQEMKKNRMVSVYVCVVAIYGRSKGTTIINGKFQLKPNKNGIIKYDLLLPQPAKAGCFPPSA